MRAEMRAEMTTELGQVIFYIQPEGRKVYGSIFDYGYDRKLTKKLIESGFTEVKPYGDFKFTGDDGKSVARRLEEFLTEVKIICVEERLQRLTWQEPIVEVLVRHNVEIQDEDEEEA